ncbi:MAG TPA: Rieske 2Fe-2S domain-containing protein [Methylomirabilota bacterium]|jgi:phenylpropionate dioxygenase-like ring-hydroxylating dioxygenase large terminal subunit|nr:Rieske 2Fe-2S domain-containing protein [Methylomirabilota bacterium]
MLTAEDNALLTRVGPGTLMGDLMRQYWMPVVESREIAAGGRPKRVKLLGEDLVVYRGPAGQAGLVSEFCAHRRASLYFARNEERGLRCVYHGWQYAPDGRCLEQPNERPESCFQDKVTLPAYPCAERGGVVWTYMGPASPPPPLPDLEWALVPAAQRFVSKFWQDCNYLQGLEGGVDPAHISFLHGILNTRDEEERRALDRAAAGFGFAAQLERAPHIEVADTPTGLLLGARREAPAGQYYWRITQYLLPFHTMPPPEVGDDPVFHTHVWIPMDDHRLVNWCVSWHPSRALTSEEIAEFQAGSSIHVMDYAPATNEAYGDIRPAASRPNDYLADWEAQRTRKFFGVPGVGAQDKAITESQAAYDRTLERLGRADLGIIRVRKRLLDAAQALRAQRVPPPGLDAASYRVRPAAVLLAKDVPWVEGAQARLVAG